ncbi:MAG TPA: glycosyltransferase family 39 protein [Chloroflexia bacterium]|jgi:4-amino-4-deoxy-L-arabinose transferase-like glycosyltransferase
MTTQAIKTTPATRRRLRLGLWLLPVLLGLVWILLSYHLVREQAVDIGNAGDTAFISGFHSDEADLTYRYRWTRERATVTFHGTGTADPTEVLVQAQGFRPAGYSEPATMSVSLEGSALLVEPSVVTLTNSLDTYRFTLSGAATAQPYTIVLNTPTFNAPGDPRPLGAKIARVELKQSGDGLNLPPPAALLWPLVLIGGLAYLLLQLPSLLGYFLVLPATAVVLAVVMLYRPYAAAYLTPLAFVFGLAALLHWQRGSLRRWPNWVDRLGKLANARRLMLGALGLYALVSLWVLPQVDWIGHADYAENAVIARNFVQGKGLTVDYVAQFYDPHPGLSHPAETWPLLQPLSIAPFFALFGPLTWVAKLPNLLVMLALAWLVFSLATRLWDSRVGLLAGLFTLAHPYFFNSVLYPINDLGFTLIFFALAWLVWHALSPYHDISPEDARDEGLVQVERTTGRRERLLVGVGVGALAGLLVWSKPSGAILLLGLLLWAGSRWLRLRRLHTRGLDWRALLPMLLAFALVLAPYFARSMLAFGKPFFSTEGYDAWILRYWPGHNWEDIYKYYVGGELPNFRWVVGGKFGYQALFDAIGLNLGWVWQRGVLGQQGTSDFVFGLLPLTGALVGLAASTRRVAGLFGMVGLCVLLYGLFVLTYWHYEGRYFQVAVPWLYMLLAWGIFWTWDRLRAALNDGLGRRWGLLLLPLLAAMLLWPSLDAIGKQIEEDVQPTGTARGMLWLRDNTTPQDVIMTRDPWELNWYSERRAVMIPNDDLATIEKVARQYGVTYLQLDGIDTRQCPDDPAAPQSSFPTGSRPALGALYCGIERPGFDLVYRQGALTIYRWSLP